MPLYAITMPKWGLSMEEGAIIEWRFGEGDYVPAEADLVDIETSKITNTLQAQTAGVLRRIIAQAGETFACGQLIAVMDEAGESGADEIAAFIAAAASAAKREVAQAAPEARMVTAGGVKLRYLSMGDAGTPVVLLHGFGGDLNTWMFVQPDLAATRTVFAFDLPGHGGSDKAVITGAAGALAEPIAAALADLGVTRAHLVGHSLGGAVSALLAARNPALAASLTLIAPAGLGAEIDGTYLSGFLEARKRRDLIAVLGRLFADPALATSDMAEDVLRQKRLDGVEGALATIKEANFESDRQKVSIRAELSALSAPVLLLWGAEDCIIPPAHAEGVAAEIHTIANAGHMPHIEQAAAAAALIASFLGRADSE